MSVRDWSGILCELLRERDSGTGAGFENGILERGKISEQRYSGKPDGVAGTPSYEILKR